MSNNWPEAKTLLYQVEIQLEKKSTLAYYKKTFQTEGKLVKKGTKNAVHIVVWQMTDMQKFFKF